MTITYIPDGVTIRWAVADGFVPGDYVELHHNSGSGAVDYDNPADGREIQLFPHGTGNVGYGWGFYGHTRYGHSTSYDCTGYGHLSYGNHNYGHGATLLQVRFVCTVSGTWTFAFVAYDEIDNDDVGTPGEVSVVMCLTPEQPSPLIGTVYNSTTDVLTMIPA